MALTKPIQKKRQNTPPQPMFYTSTGCKSENTALWCLSFKNVYESPGKPHSQCDYASSREYREMVKGRWGWWIMQLIFYGLQSWWQLIEGVEFRLRLHFIGQNICCGILLKNHFLCLIELTRRTGACDMQIQKSNIAREKGEAFLHENSL